MSIRTSNLLYTLFISNWTARKLDKKASREVKDNHAASDKAGNFNKHLLPGAQPLEEIIRYGSECRVWFYANTLPWGDNGERIGRAERHLDFMQEMGDRRREYQRLVDTFVAAYPTLYTAAQFDLNDLFDPNDYPQPHEIGSKFAFRFTVATLPASEDFRVVEGLAQSDADALVAETTALVEQRVGEAMQDAYARLAKTVGAMAEKLAIPIGEKGAVFRDSLTENVVEIAGMLPALNIVKDPKLDALANQARALVGGLSLTDLRKDPDARADAAQKAKDLLAAFGE